MPRELPGGYELDDDAARIDRAVVHRFLAEGSYRAVGGSREVVVAPIEGSQRVVGLDHAGSLVGFARVVTDKAVFAMLDDAFALEAHRGRGLGAELVRVTIDAGPYANLSWGLTTSDAQVFYESHGFHALTGATVMVRSRRGQVGMR